MARSVTLRRWQKDALERLGAHAGTDFLAVATPGSGKTTFALTAARQFLAAPGAPEAGLDTSGPAAPGPRGPGRRLVVVVPTAHLKVQWARAAAAFDLHLDPQWAPADGALPADMHGIVTTYQQVAGCAAVLAPLAADAFVIFDEVHHAADDRAWGDAVRVAFEPAGRRLALSGTPFRSDVNAIPFVSYRLDEAVADFEYGYGDALADGGVVRPVYFPRVDGMMEWSAPDGTVHAHAFDDPLDAARAGQRLRTAYSLEGEWLPHVLRQAHAQLLGVRGRHPDAAGLVIATDQDHAKGIARLLRDRFGVRAVVATSDDPDASARISRFATGTDPWIVAVRMVSEGVDIPRLRVGVFATTTTTELFFRQAVGRLVRWTRGQKGQQSFLFIPDDRRLRARAFAITEQRRHSLRHDDRELIPRPPGELDEFVEEQFSLFAPISAVPIGDARVIGVDGDAEWVLDDDAGYEPTDDASLTIPLPPLPLGAGRRGAGPGGLTLREHKEALREANSGRVRSIARLTGLTHAAVNAELNRISGVRRVSEATVDQLEGRLERATKWWRQLVEGRAAG